MRRLLVLKIAFTLIVICFTVGCDSPIKWEGYLVHTDRDEVSVTSKSYEETESEVGINPFTASVGRVFYVPNGTRAGIIEEEIMDSKVKILEGEYAGSKGYVLNDNIMTEDEFKQYENKYK